MLVKVALRLIALLTLAVASGCSHLPSLSAINPFSQPNHVSDEVVVVESAPVSPVVLALSPTPQMPPSLTPAKSKSASVEGPQLVAAKAIKPVPPAVTDAAPRPLVASLFPEPKKNPGVKYSAKAVALEETEGVMDLPSTYWAVQIAAVKDIGRVAEMVKEHRLQGMLGVPMNTEAGPLHAVLTGVFVKREDALASLDELPPVLAGYKPWIRPLAHLQAAMR